MFSLRKSLITLAIVVLCFPLMRAEDAHDAWEVDYDHALTLAKASGKHILVDFTGSDWCIWCKRLEGEVFSQDAFLEYAKENLIMVMLDFPNGKKVENAVRNNELKDEFKITGFPTILLLDENGKPYAKTGYQENGPEPYIKHLELLKGKAKELQQIMARVAGGSGDQKKSGLDRFFTYTQSLGKSDLDFGHNFSIGFPNLTATLNEAIAMDPDNQEGLKLKAAVFLLETGDIDDNLKATIESLDPDNKQGYLERVVKAEIYNFARARNAEGILQTVESFIGTHRFKDANLGTDVLFLAGNATFLGLKQNEKALTFIKKALEICPADSPMKDNLETLAEKIEAAL